MDKANYLLQYADDKQCSHCNNYPTNAYCGLTNGLTNLEPKPILKILMYEYV